MNEIQTNVRRFMDTMGQECPQKPTIPSLEVRALRAKLILEETQETIAALGFEVRYEMRWRDTGKANLTEIADGIADLNYVAYGTAIACGLDMAPIEAEVHRSNMSKLGTDGKILKNKDGKVVKPPSFSPPDIASLIKAQETP